MFSSIFKKHFETQENFRNRIWLIGEGESLWPSRGRALDVSWSFFTFLAKIHDNFSLCCKEAKKKILYKNWKSFFCRIFFSSMKLTAWGLLNELVSKGKVFEKLSPTKKQRKRKESTMGKKSMNKKQLLKFILGKLTCEKVTGSVHESLSCSIYSSCKIRSFCFPTSCRII